MTKNQHLKCNQKLRCRRAEAEYEKDKTREGEKRCQEEKAQLKEGQIGKADSTIMDYPFGMKLEIKNLLAYLHFETISDLVLRRCDLSAVMIRHFSVAQSPQRFEMLL